jgi:hypothetical protein
VCRAVSNDSEDADEIVANESVSPYTKKSPTVLPSIGNGTKKTAKSISNSNKKPKYVAYSSHLKIIYSRLVGKKRAFDTSENSSVS